VEIDVSDALYPARADANQVEMAILNLAVNARDAMPEGGTLTISAKPATIELGDRSSMPAGRYVRLSVADTGTGMDEATLKRAIEPFFSTKGIGRGTGLGLSMVHGLASQLGGGLAISSKPGLGTCVELFLPASDEVARPADRTENIETRSAAGTVLLVDDEDLVRGSTADMLAELGYAVTEAGSAEEALRLVNGGLEPDLLITDHLMPGMSGTDLAHELRARSRDLPVLLVSGYAEAEGVAPDLVRLVKPFRQADLAAKLRELDDETTA
jgi:CheY-like chemotaxis protein